MVSSTCIRGANSAAPRSSSVTVSYLCALGDAGWPGRLEHPGVLYQCATRRCWINLKKLQSRQGCRPCASSRFLLDVFQPKKWCGPWATSGHSYASGCLDTALGSGLDWAETPRCRVRNRFLAKNRGQPGLSPDLQRRQDRLECSVDDRRRCFCPISTGMAANSIMSRRASVRSLVWS